MNAKKSTPGYAVCISPGVSSHQHVIFGSIFVHQSSLLQARLLLSRYMQSQLQELPLWRQAGRMLQSARIPLCCSILASILRTFAASSIFSSVYPLIRSNLCFRPMRYPKRSDAAPVIASIATVRTIGVVISSPADALWSNAAVLILRCRSGMT